MGFLAAQRRRWVWRTRVTSVDAGRRPGSYDRHVILRCTKKFLTLLGQRPGADLEPVPTADDWYANLLWFDRRKCLLLTHAGTLFSIFEADVRASALRDTRRIVADLIGRELAREKLPAGTFGAVDKEELIVARTADRSVLGCMNDMALLCGHAIAGSGGLRQTNVAELNRSLRRNLNSARGYQQPIDLAAARVRHAQ